MGVQWPGTPEGTVGETNKPNASVEGDPPERLEDWRWIGNTPCKPDGSITRQAVVSGIPREAEKYDDRKTPGAWA